MTTTFITVLNMSITASIVVLAVILARIPLRKAPKIFSYALWGVVLFRLVFPFSIESAFSLMPASANVIPHEIVLSQNPATQSEGQPAEIAVPVINITDEYPLSIQERNADTIYIIFEMAGYIWLFGFILLLAYGIMGYASLKRRVCFATLVRDNIFEADTIKTPFVLGFIRPRIYFPTTINPLKHDYILMHEQVHIKRRDYLIKSFAYIVFALHWFNPFMWIAYFLMSKDMEMSCDEAVLKGMHGDIRKDYSMSLLNLSTRRVSLLSPIAFAFGESNVKERINNVLRYKKSARWVTVVSIAAMSVFLIGFSFDRVLALDMRPEITGHSRSASLTYSITNWSIDSSGRRVAGAYEAEEIGLAILDRYFSGFRNDWDNWEDAMFSITSAPTPWFGRVSDDISGIGARFFTPPFIFYVDDETDNLISASFFPQIEYIMTSISPFAIGIEEAIGIYGDWWHEPLPIGLHSNYINMLTDFSLGLLNGSGFSNNTIISADVISARGSFSNAFVNIDIGVSFACGKNATLAFWVFETYFAIVGFTINY